MAPTGPTGTYAEQLTSSNANITGSNSNIMMSSVSGVTYYAKAHRQRGGICIGTIWCCIITSKNNHITNSNNKQQQRNIFSNSFTNTLLLFRGGGTTIDPCNIRYAIPMYCILIGHVLYAYESETEYNRGDTPIHIWTIVGASLWFPHKLKHAAAKKSDKGDSAASASAAVATTNAATTTTNNNNNNNSSTNFRFVSNQGTQVYCWTNSINNHECFIWLSSIQTGLQLSLEYTDITPAVMPVVPPIIPKAKSTTTTTSTSTGSSGSLTVSALSTSSIRYCRVCGVLAASNVTGTALSIVDPNFYSTAQQSATAVQHEHYIPLIQYGIEDKYGPPGNDNGPASPSNHMSNSSSSYQNSTGSINPNYYVCMNCNISQGVVQYIQFIRTLYIADMIEQSIILQFYTAAMDALLRAKDEKEPHDTNTGSRDVVDDSLVVGTEQEVVTDNNELGTNQHDNKNDSNDDKLIAVADDDDSSNVTNEVTNGTTGYTTTTTSTLSTTTNIDYDNNSTDTTTRVLLNFVQSSKLTIDEWTRQCGTLYNLIHDVFVPGYIDGVELMDSLEEIVGTDNIITNNNNNDNTNTSKISASVLKQQAFRNCAGDMGTAMKLLLEQAIPNNNSSSSKSMDISNRDTFANNNDDVDVFRCVLEFLLDLCDNDNDHKSTAPSTLDDIDTLSSPVASTTSNLSSIAFFWPQLCHIHLRMLPATNATSLARIDLMEDFLLTVATKYSIHLALELVWSHTADLEESLQVSSSSSLMEQSTNEASMPQSDVPSSSTENVSSACRRRRFAIIRFLCELESLLFDFDGGWGGGSVTLGKMFLPTPHQVHIMKVAMTYIQQYRMGIQNENDSNKIPIRSKSRCLSRSARWNRLLREYDNSNGDDVKSPAEQAQEKLQIAKNADYFSSHLIFSKRLADIAEKLRFIDVSERASVLEHELNLLNVSGVMGGDPLNRLRDHLIRVVRVPSTESHVFRSKERTPILLLMEIIDEKIETSASPSSNDTKSTTVETPPLIQVPTVSTRVEDAEGNDIAEGHHSPAFENLSTGQPTSETNPVPIEGKDDNAPKPPLRAPTLSEGALEGFLRLSPGPKALKRFDAENESSNLSSLTTPKDTVQRIVSNAAEEQLRDIALPKLDHIPSIPNTISDTKNDFTNGKGSSNDTIGSDPISPLKTTSKVRSEMDESARGSRKISTLSTLKGINDNAAVDSTNTLAPTGDIRRAVLTTIMMQGLQGNTIAAGTTDSVQLSLKDLERKRATELLLSGEDDEAASNDGETDIETTRERLFALGLTPSLDEVELASRPTEEDEVLEAIRLMLIQNQVAQGHLSPADAAKVLQHTSLSAINSSNIPTTPDGETKPVDMSDHPIIDAGDVDPRLVGCGPLPPAVLQALTLWKGGMVTHAELLELVKKDIEFVKHSILVDADNLNMLKENSAFWGRFAFGERWAEKKSRIGSSSPQRTASGWDLMGVIVKSNDDLRQEAFIMQLIELCQEAFELAELELWISPYRILATGRTTGVIECVRNAMSFDALKKRPGYGKGGLREHLHRMTEFTADPGGSFKSAQQNFVRSLAAYSLLSYLFQFKDRHNGNLLLDTAGHVIHIDFGFVFGIAPGGSFSLEMSTPFKLTEEMLDVMGGLRSPLFSEFVTLFCCGFLALQAHCETFLTLVEITSRDSTFKCFDGRDTEEIVAKLRERFNPDASKEETVSFALDLIKQATTSYGTRQYDIYQYLSQGIY